MTGVHLAIGPHNREVLELFFNNWRTLSPKLANAKDTSGKTPLHLAAAYGYVDIINDFLHAGADINAVTIVNISHLLVGK